MILAALIFLFGLFMNGSAQRENTKPSICNSGVELIPHPTLCQRYTNCSQTPGSRYTVYLKEYEEECPYPQLFDIVEKKCKHFKEANCGAGRAAATDPCDYIKNRCGGSHCEPCASRWPSCVGRQNGIYAHPSKLWSPYYIECDTERTVGVRWCPRHGPTNYTTVFNPEKKACVPPWEIPKDHGGLEPGCDGKEAKLHRVSNLPGVYYACPAPVVFYCEKGSTFNEVKQSCEQTTSQLFIKKV